MLWLFASPGHRQPRYWQYSIYKSLSVVRKVFNYLHHITAEKWKKMQTYLIFPQNNSACQELMGAQSDITAVTATFNSLAPGSCGSNFKCNLDELILQIKCMCTSCEIALRWLPQIAFDEKSRLVQEMAWCHQATSHYINQSWCRSMSSYSVTRPQWVNRLWIVPGHYKIQYLGPLLLTWINFNPNRDK